MAQLSFRMKLWREFQCIGLALWLRKRRKIKCCCTGWRTEEIRERRAKRNTKVDEIGKGAFCCVARPSTKNCQSGCPIPDWEWGSAGGHWKLHFEPERRVEFAYETMSLQYARCKLKHRVTIFYYVTTISSFILRAVSIFTSSCDQSLL